MIYHLILLLSICFIYLIWGDNPSNRKKSVVFMSLCLWIFYSLRSWTVGSDTVRYYANFVYASDMSFSEIWLYYATREPVFYSFCKILSLIVNDPQFFVAIVGAVVCSSFAFFAYHQRGNVLLMYILFVTLRVFPFMMTGMRQAMAMSILLVSYVFMQKGYKKYYLAGSFMAFLFHTSSLIVPLVVYGLTKLRNKTIISIISLICIFTGVIIASTGGILTSVVELIFGGDKYVSYSNTVNESFRMGGTFLLYVVLYLAIWINKRKLSKMEDNFDLELGMLSVAMMFSIMTLRIPTAFRMAYYFQFPMFSMATFLIASIWGNRNKKTVIFIFVLLMITQYMILGSGADIGNYEFFWENPYQYMYNDLK